MKSKFKISTIIPTYNRSRLLGYTLESLTAQTLSNASFEIIVVDDGSTDDTREVIRNFQEKLNIKYLYQEDKGYRPASARNIGISVSEGEICVLIDSGVLLHEDCLEEHLLFHRTTLRSAAIGYVYGFEENEEHRTQLEELIDPFHVGLSISRLENQEKFEDVRIHHYRKYNFKIHSLPAPWLYFWTCHVSAIRSDLMEANLFDMNYDGRWGVEDNDMGFRLLQNGVKLQVLSAAKSLHYPHDKEKEARHKEGYKNCIYFNNKFRTPETQLFLDHFMAKEFFDINESVLKLKHSGQTDQEIEKIIISAV